MRNIRETTATVKPPTDVVPYLDAIVLWLPTPIEPRTFKKLRRCCGSLREDPNVVTPDPRFHIWHPKLRYRLILRQPNETALRWVACRADGLVNGVEVTLDFIYDTPAAATAARAYLHRHLTRRWHCGQKIEFYDKDEDKQRYDGPPTARNIITDYPQEICRLTGQLNCVHVEWRARGSVAVRAAGIHCPRHVLTFNHRAFWQRRLRLVAIDPGRLGRWLRNRQAPRRQHAITAADERDGRRVIRRLGNNTAQGLLDAYRGLRIEWLLTPLPQDPWLPSPSVRTVTPYRLSTYRNYDNLDRRDDRRDETSDPTGLKRIDVRRINVRRTDGGRTDGRRRTPALTLYQQTSPRVIAERSKDVEPKQK
jgi:hypothetical protein